ncbi:MAG: hypothetical protein JXR58_02995 [Bacteroidales bacterium]|nr:hypothetical protein [Bacteroidales bacterium]
MKKYKSWFFLSILLVFASCHQNKMLEKATSIYIDDSSLNIELNRDVNNKYIDNSGKDEYLNSFISALKDELNSCNLIITDNPEKAEFSIRLNSLLLKEYSSTNTVNDAASEYNGMTYVLSNCDVSSGFTIFKGTVAAGNKIDEMSQFANKEEKLTNNRNVGDYIFSTNKDNSTYRQKELNEKVFINLVEKCGRRTTAAISKRLYKYLKKGK